MMKLDGTRRATLLLVLETAYPLLFLGVLVLILVAMLLLMMRRRRSSRGRRLLIRMLLASVAALLALLLGECSSSLYSAWLHRAPRLKMAVAPASRSGSNQDATIVVVGESSAEGVPYRDWLSVGKLVVWQLRWVFPRRMFHLEVQARPGWTLEQMHQRLAESTQPPDAVILYAGHNEFSSRYGWSSSVPYYQDDPRSSAPARLVSWVSLHSPLCRLIHEFHERTLVAALPETQSRNLADVPSHTASEHQMRLNDFRCRLEILLGDLKAAGVLTIVIVPPGNDAGFEPNRSILPATMPRADREAFCRQFLEARGLELSDPEQSIARYRVLIECQPGFAEAHFRLARLLERAGHNEEAYSQYVLARDLDGHPMRCLSSFQQIYRELAVRFGAILVDGQALFHARHACGQLDDSLFHDAMHPTLEGYVALAEGVLAALKERGAFGWAASSPPPTIDLATCARHFDVTPAAWMAVCRFAAGFYRTTLRIRFDPAERTRKAQHYEAELQRLEEGAEPKSLHLVGSGIRS